MDIKKIESESLRFGKKILTVIGGGLALLFLGMASYKGREERLEKEEIIIIDNRVDKIEDRVTQLPLQKPSLELKTENVIGGEKPEKFYEFNGQRLYLEIDGKPVGPVGNYFQDRNKR